MIVASPNRSSAVKKASRIRAGLLRQLAAAPLSEWPQALAECLDSLSASGVCHPSTLSELSQPVGRAKHQGLGAPGARLPAVRDRAPSPAEKNGARSAHVKGICVFLRTHYGERISLDSHGARVGRNTAYIATLFRRQTGMTIHRYLTRIRMRRAAMLLRRSEKVEAVMLLVGYRGKKNFYRQFEAVFGVTPGQYKASHPQRRVPLEDSF